LFKSRLRAAIPALMAVLAGCQPLPQPFQPEQSRKESNPLLRLPDRAGVLVRPVAGLPPETAHALSAAVAAALVKRNIPAFTETGNRESLIMGGRVDKRDGIAKIEWRLFELTQSQSEYKRIVTSAPAIPAPAAGTDAIAPIADRAADAIAARIQNPALRDRTATLKKRYLHVAPVSGAPDEAAAVLRSEIESALRRNAFRVSGTMRENSLIVSGSVDLSEGRAGKKRMSLDWTVSRPDGQELGKLSQSNDVDPVELDRDWPAIARGIAISAALGLRQLLDKIPEKAVEPPSGRSQK